MQDSTITTEQVEEADRQTDTLFGICQAIGEDFGFDPFYLRVALIAVLFFSPTAMLGTYVALGVTVAASRWLFPKPKAAANVEAMALTVSAESPAEIELEREPELIAA